MAILVLGALASYGAIARAEDNEDSGANIKTGREMQKKQDEQAREAEKKQFENSREADKKLFEADRETRKKQWENAREANKKMEEASSTDESTGEIKRGEREDNEANEHGNEVSFTVHTLLDIASSTENHGIGEEVRKVAQEQNDNKDKAVNAIKDVKGQSAFITFLIGANAKSLGELKNSIETTDNHISRLSEIKDSATTSPEVKTALDSEIRSLAIEKERLEKIVTSNENKISLFGWLIKLFR